MNRFFLLFCIFALLSGFAQSPASALKEGDIIFQSSASSDARAIELATHSRFSHVGIILYKGGKPYVFEAVEPVQFLPLEIWTKRGKDGYYEVRRLKNSENILTKNVLSRFHEVANGFEGKKYDPYFSWGDEKLYCSELVWKLYKRAAGVELGPVRKFKDYDFTHPLVQQKLKERYGNKLPMDETVVSPEDIYKSGKLMEVKIRSLN